MPAKTANVVAAAVVNSFALFQCGINGEKLKAATAPNIGRKKAKSIK